MDRTFDSLTQAGSGDPILLLDWTPWQSSVLADALAEKYRVISIEPPSDAGSPGTVDDTAEAVVQVAESAGLVPAPHLYRHGGMTGERRPCILVGVSLGADVALRVALLRPESVAALVLVSPLCVEPALYVQETGPWNTPELAAGAMLTDSRFRGNDGLLPDAGRTATLSALAERWRTPLDDGDTDAADLLPGVDCATLAVFGQEDRLVSRGAGGVWKERVPNGNVCYVYDAGHAIVVERPGALVNVVLDFVQRRETFIVENRSFLVNP